MSRHMGYVCLSLFLLNPPCSGTLIYVYTKYPVKTDAQHFPMFTKLLLHLFYLDRRSLTHFLFVIQGTPGKRTKAPHLERLQKLCYGSLGC
jgi:hypothetical protein